MPASLSIFGAGRLAQTLARLWQQHAVFNVQQLHCRQLTSCTQAQQFIGATSAQCIDKPDQLEPANIWLVATPDSAFGSAQDALEPLIRPGDIVFHCSGALASDQFISLQDRGALVASIHPLHSFANPESSIKQFAGSYCAYEGDSEALQVLLPAFEKIAGQCFAINGDKWLYHAASVIACNYLAPLLNASYQAFAGAGIDQSLADKLLQPLLAGTLDNIQQQGPAAALTGPIARGDSAFVLQQLDALTKHKPELGKLYQDMAMHTTQLALTRDNSESITKALRGLQESLNRQTQMAEK